MTTGLDYQQNITDSGKRKYLKKNFTISGPCIVIYLLNKDEKDALFFLNSLNQSTLYMLLRD